MAKSKSNAPSLASKQVLTLEIAKLAAAGAETYAAKNGLSPLGIAITDDGGNLVLFHRQTGVVEGGARYARLKAQTAGLLGSSTRFIGNLDYGDPARPLGIGEVEQFTITPGGFPIHSASGQLLGGIGVSGAAAEDDEAAAKAGIEAVKDCLG